jgi:hypothetical protein
MHRRISPDQPTAYVGIVKAVVAGDGGQIRLLRFFGRHLIHLV